MKDIYIRCNGITLFVPGIIEYEQSKNEVTVYIKDPAGKIDAICAFSKKNEITQPIQIEVIESN